VDAVAGAFRMTDETWFRHAHPWSVFTRFAAIPPLVLSIWSRAWIGWWCLLPLAAVALWLWLNPRVFPPVRTPTRWASKGIHGEMLWARRPPAVPTAHRTAFRLIAVPGVVGIQNRSVPPLTCTVSMTASDPPGRSTWAGRLSRTAGSIQWNDVAATTRSNAAGSSATSSNAPTSWAGRLRRSLAGRLLAVPSKCPGGRPARPNPPLAGPRRVVRSTWIARRPPVSILATGTDKEVFADRFRGWLSTTGGGHAPRASTSPRTSSCRPGTASSSVRWTTSGRVSGTRRTPGCSSADPAGSRASPWFAATSRTSTVRSRPR
jgi:hypothetical protein